MKYRRKKKGKYKKLAKSVLNTFVSEPLLIWKRRKMIKGPICHLAANNPHFLSGKHPLSLSD